MYTNKSMLDWEKITNSLRIKKKCLKKFKLNKQVSPKKEKQQTNIWDKLR